MRKLNAKQKRLVIQFVKDYKASAGCYPSSVDDINPLLWHEIENLNDHETLYQNANRLINDYVINAVHVNN